VRYRSTRGAAAVPLDEALVRGIARDGGLMVPEQLPRFAMSDFDGLEAPWEIALRLLTPFFAGDRLADELPAICREALNFPIPLRPVGADTEVLELFHGPTAAFKDVGARFLSQCLARIPGEPGRTRTVLVATSGDTGGAVGAAFHGQEGTAVVILFPKGRVSARQQHQLTCWGDNVSSLAVRGDFDDCQRLVKAAFADPELRAARDLTSANSINMGRLLPQSAYYAASSLWHFRATGRPASYVIPSGNIGNAVGCLWAREMGLPIDRIVVATNVNRVVPDFLETGEYRARRPVATLASAMDVGDPSNMERVLALFPQFDELRSRIRAFSVTDDEIRDEIRRGPDEWGEIWDPHTAAGIHVRRRLEGSDWIVVATAHPAKFEGIVEPLVGRPVPVPDSLESLFSRPAHYTEIDATLGAFREALLQTA
jgi:threonine synthase